MTEVHENDLILIEKDYVLVVIIKLTIIIVGVLLNALNLFVLTRNKLTTTSLYLVAISTVDLIRLLGNITNCLEYFQWIHIGFEHYWTIRPIFSLITFSSQAMSLFFITFFSIDRYIAYKNPLKIHFFNKRTTTKYIIFFIVLICFLPRIPLTMNIVSKENVTYNEKTNKFNCIYSGMEKNLNFNNRYDVSSSNVTEILGQRKHTNVTKIFVLDNINTENNNSRNLIEFETNDCKEVVYYTALFRKQNRPAKWFRLTIVTFYGLIPTLVLILFNTKFIILLRKNKEKRTELTTSIVSKQQITTDNNCPLLISKESRLILQLIIIKAVVAFLRIPYFILMYFLPTITSYDKNIYRIIGQISSSSLDLNAALNFFLFCLLSDYNRNQFIKTMSKLCCRSTEENQNNEKIRPIQESDRNIGYI